MLSVIGFSNVNLHCCILCTSLPPYSPWVWKTIYYHLCQSNVLYVWLVLLCLHFSIQERIIISKFPLISILSSQSHYIQTATLGATFAESWGNILDSFLWKGKAKHPVQYGALQTQKRKLKKVPYQTELMENTFLISWLCQDTIITGKCDSFCFLYLHWVDYFYLLFIFIVTCFQLASSFWKLICTSEHIVMWKHYPSSLQLNYKWDVCSRTNHIEENITRS